MTFFSELTAPWLETASRTDVAFCFIPGAGLHYQSGAGTDVMILKNIFAEKNCEKIGAFDSKQS
jgi:hypothetical protein